VATSSGRAGAVSAGFPEPARDTTPDPAALDVQTAFRPASSESSDIVTVIDSAGTVLYQTPSVSRVLGHVPGTWVGQPFLELVRPDQHASYAAALAAAARSRGRGRTIELALAARVGTWRHTETTITALRTDDSPLPAFVLATRDVSDRRRLRDLLEADDDVDPLTGRATLPALRRQVMEALRCTPRGQVALLVLDIEGFAGLSSTLGRQRSDELIVAVGRLLARCVRPWDVVARLGGDEFAVLVVGSNAERSVVRVQERIRRALAGTVLPDGVEVEVRVNAGYALNDSGSESAEDLLRNADLALTRVRTSRRMELLRFDSSMNDALVRRVQSSHELHRAIAGNELELHYQPIVWLPGRRVVGAEALVRWRHPTRGLLPASEFVPLAEDLGLGDELAEWVTRTAAQTLALALDRHPYDDLFKVGINVSAEQLVPGLVGVVASALSAAGAPVDRFVVEVTEAGIARAEDAAAVVTALRAAGVRVGIGNFGVGATSLGYLADHGVDYIKVDRSFVRDIDTDASRAALTEAIIVLGEAMSLPPIVEGVESEAELDVLYAAGCRYVQGRLLSDAVCQRDLLAALDAQNIGSVTA